MLYIVIKYMLINERIIVNIVKGCNSRDLSINNIINRNFNTNFFFFSLPGGKNGEGKRGTEINKIS